MSEEGVKIDDESLPTQRSFQIDRSQGLVDWRISHPYSRYWERNHISDENLCLQMSILANKTKSPLSTLVTVHVAITDSLRFFRCIEKIYANPRSYILAVNGDRSRDWELVRIQRFVDKIRSRLVNVMVIHWIKTYWDEDCKYCPPLAHEMILFQKLIRESVTSHPDFVQSGNRLALSLNRKIYKNLEKHCKMSYTRKKRDSQTRSQTTPTSRTRTRSKSRAALSSEEYGTPTDTEDDLGAVTDHDLSEFPRIVSPLHISVPPRRVTPERTARRTSLLSPKPSETPLARSPSPSQNRTHEPGIITVDPDRPPRLTHSTTATERETPRASRSASPALNGSGTTTVTTGTGTGTGTGQPATIADEKNEDGDGYGIPLQRPVINRSREMPIGGIQRRPSSRRHNITGSTNAEDDSFPPPRPSRRFGSHARTNSLCDLPSSKELTELPLKSPRVRRRMSRSDRKKSKQIQNERRQTAGSIRSFLKLTRKKDKNSSDPQKNNQSSSSSTAASSARERRVSILQPNTGSAVDIIGEDDVVETSQTETPLKQGRDQPLPTRSLSRSHRYPARMQTTPDLTISIKSVSYVELEEEKVPDGHLGQCDLSYMDRILVIERFELDDKMRESRDGVKSQYGKAKEKSRRKSVKQRRNKNSKQAPLSARRGKFWSVSTGGSATPPITQSANVLRRRGSSKTPRFRRSTTHGRSRLFGRTNTNDDPRLSGLVTVRFMKNKRYNPIQNGRDTRTFDEIEIDVSNWDLFWDHLNGWIPYFPKSLKVIELDPQDVAQQMTLLTNQIFNKIHPREYLYAQWQDKKRPRQICINLNRMIILYNHQSNWVKKTLLFEAQNRDERGHFFDQFLRIAQICWDLNNFFSFWAIKAGLSSTYIQRLPRTSSNRHLNSWYDETFYPMETRQIDKYQERNRPTPAIPYPANINGRFFNVEQRNTKTFLKKRDPSRLDLEKIKQIAKIWELVEHMRYQDYRFFPKKDIQAFLKKEWRASAIQKGQEDQFYKLAKHIRATQ